MPSVPQKPGHAPPLPQPLQHSAPKLAKAGTWAEDGAVVEVGVGAGDGAKVGAEVRAAVGAMIGVQVGAEVGVGDGAIVGVEVGAEVGARDGAAVGAGDGAGTGARVGAETEAKDGGLVWARVGAEVGARARAGDGAAADWAWVSGAVMLLGVTAVGDKYGWRLAGAGIVEADSSCCSVTEGNDCGSD